MLEEKKKTPKKKPQEVTAWRCFATPGMFMAETGTLQREVELSLHTTFPLLDVSVHPCPAQPHLSPERLVIGYHLVTTPRVTTFVSPAVKHVTSASTEPWSSFKTAV